MEPAEKNLLRRLLIVLALLSILCGALLAIIWDNTYLTWSLLHLQNALETGERLRKSILAYGPLAPILFIVLQLLQVVFAPIPGEATGVLGGYLFGAWPGFIYSSIALTMGSGIAFAIGQLLSSTLKHRYKQTKVYQQFNHLVAKGDFVIPFVLFLLPGFPKDSLSYLLGFSFMPFKVFLFIAAVARMPGTLLLSLEGAKVYEAAYVELLILVLVSVAVSVPCYLFRKKILAALNRYNKSNEKP
jgi:uncharacterized membrane protein YdjX (TVP38/TMEM64 family)